MTNVDAKHRAAPAANPLPSNFPVKWDNPDDEQLFWTRDPLHFVDQMPPLEFSIISEAYWPAFYAAAESYELLEIGPRVRLINTYYYSTMLSVIAPPEELAARARRSEAKLIAALPRLGTLWNEKWLPEINQHMAHLESFDLPGSSLAELREHLEQAIDRFERLFQIHYRFFFPATLALGLFEEFYCELFGDGGTPSEFKGVNRQNGATGQPDTNGEANSENEAFDAYRLLQGFDNKILETDRALWSLSRAAQADPTVRSVLGTEDAANVLRALGATDNGRSFLAKLYAFLRKYGKRSGKQGVSRPFWVEDPTPVVNRLKSYLAQPDRDMIGELKKAAAAREELLAKTRQRLSAYPRATVDQFEMLLTAAQTATMLMEDHSFWLDCRVSYHVRQVLLEIGRRLTMARAVTKAEDIFYLTLAELRETARFPLQLVRKSLIAERQAEYERFRELVPPLRLGVPPSDLVPDIPSKRIFAAKLRGMRRTVHLVH